MTIEPSELWHRRLAHVHYRALPIASKVVEGLPKFQAKHDGVCKGCAKGKNTKKTFPRRSQLNLGMDMEDKAPSRLEFHFISTLRTNFFLHFEFLSSASHNFFVKKRPFINEVLLRKISFQK